MSDELSRFRHELDAVDAELLDVLARRARLVDALWAWKDAEGLPRIDPERERALRARLLRDAERKGLSAEAVGRLLDVLVGRRLSR